MISIPESDLVACICEGTAEKTIVELLLTRDALVFSQDRLLDKKILNRTYMDAKRFSDQFLTMDYGDTKISVIVVQDRKIPYVIKAPYKNKISDTYLAITAPEIEMLMIHSLELYDEYNKYHKKPSIFLAEQLKMKTSEIKSYPYICKFYENHDIVNAIRTHKRKSQAMNRGCFLADILK